MTKRDATRALPREATLESRDPARAAGACQRAACNLQLRSSAMTERQILVVDDEQETCDLLEMVLEREGYAVTTSTSAQHALELVGAQDFDVVLTDLSMPEMSGLELCERVLGTRPERARSSSSPGREASRPRSARSASAPTTSSRSRSTRSCSSSPSRARSSTAASRTR